MWTHQIAPRALNTKPPCCPSLCLQYPPWTTLWHSSQWDTVIWLQPWVHTVWHGQAVSCGAITTLSEYLACNKWCRWTSGALLLGPGQSWCKQTALVSKWRTALCECGPSWAPSLSPQRSLASGDKPGPRRATGNTVLMLAMVALIDSPRPVLCHWTLATFRLALHSRGCVVRLEKVCAKLDAYAFFFLFNLISRNTKCADPVATH